MIVKLCAPIYTTRADGYGYRVRRTIDVFHSPSFVHRLMLSKDLRARAINWLWPETEDNAPGIHKDMDIENMVKSATDPKVCYNALDLADIDAPVPEIIRFAVSICDCHVFDQQSLSLGS